eukprot:7340140-Prymnesium_polylepis.1
MRAGPTGAMSRVLPGACRLTFNSTTKTHRDMEESGFGGRVWGVFGCGECAGGAHKRDDSDEDEAQ